jgi:two-component system, NtrC family, response regulator AtoC
MQSVSTERAELCETYLGMPAVFRSELMQELLSLVTRVARSSAAVLITGESGTGKELIARALHHHSLRCNKPWVDVNCGALPEHLVESELFGYEKGAFSGAQGPKQGLFELAASGTLFLDEIGELEPRIQVKLLRVLDGVPYYRLGGVRKVSVDARIVTATNQDLEKAIQGGKFRGDLYHRLAQVRLHVPALRERRDDILPLAKFFLHQHDPAMRFAPSAEEAITNYGWPGNVRELRNTIVRAALLASDLQIPPSLLCLQRQESSELRPVPQATSLEAMEREMIFRVLSQTGGHHAKTAKVLGISRRTLTRKLKAYGACDDSQITESGLRRESESDRKASYLPLPVRG